MSELTEPMARFVRSVQLAAGEDRGFSLRQGTGFT